MPTASILHSVGLVGLPQSRVPFSASNTCVHRLKSRLQKIGGSSRLFVGGSKQQLHAVSRRLHVSPPAALPGSAAGRQVASFLDAFNARSLDAMLACLSPACVYHNLAYQDPFSGKQAVQALLTSLMHGAPSGWRLVLDDATGDARSASVVFHFQDGSGRRVPLSSGMAFYSVDEAGLICRIVESSEQVLKVPQGAVPLIGAAAPILDALSSTPLGALVPGLAAAPATPPAPPSFMGGQAAAGSSSSSAGSAALLRSQGQPSAAGSPPASQGIAALSSSQGAPASSPDRSSSSSSSIPALASLAGVWIKDAEASDMASYGRACDLLGLSGLQKTTAMQLIEGLEIEQAGNVVAVRFLTVVPFFKVTERYTLDGDVSQPRRDLRPGRQQAAAEATPDGGLEVQLSWGEPNRGSIHEAYRVQGSSLVCLSTVAVAAGSVTTRTVYHRSSSWQPRFRWNPFGLGGIAQ